MTPWQPRVGKCENQFFHNCSVALEKVQDSGEQEEHFWVVFFCLLFKEVRILCRLLSREQKIGRKHIETKQRHQLLQTSCSVAPLI